MSVTGKSVNINTNFVNDLKRNSLMSFRPKTQMLKRTFQFYRKHTKYQVVLFDKNNGFLKGTKSFICVAKSFLIPFLWQIHKQNSLLISFKSQRVPEWQNGIKYRRFLLFAVSLLTLKFFSSIQKQIKRAYVHQSGCKSAYLSNLYSI